MASEMVERLAAAWASETGSRFPSQDARWWINAIAGEMERDMITGETRLSNRNWPAWLRTQAKDQSDE